MINVKELTVEQKADAIVIAEFLIQSISDDGISVEDFKTTIRLMVQMEDENVDKR